MRSSSARRNVLDGDDRPQLPLRSQQRHPTFVTDADTLRFSPGASWKLALASTGAGFGRRLAAGVPHDLHPALRSRFMAAATLSVSLKIADPATKTLAPAATTSGAVVASMPPSTSTSQA